MVVTELRRLRQLEEENFKLKQIVADLSLDKQMLQDVLKKSFEPAQLGGGWLKACSTSIRYHFKNSFILKQFY